MTDADRSAPTFAEEKRSEIRRHAASMGIDEDYICELVETFYARIRADDMVGPIFEREIGTEWGPHLERMKHFWASVALNAGSYSGKPVLAHQKLQGMTRGHFDHWLGLFRQTLIETAPTPLAVDYFMLRAKRIAASLQMAMFDQFVGAPGVPPKFGST